MSFVTDTSLYCYNVIPFRLKNVGATYQHLVNKVFAIHIEKTMEVYVDDMITKSVKEIDHVRDLEETFKLLRSYAMKLNPKKCTFGVRSGKFLIDQRGIKANPDKICLLYTSDAADE